MYCVDDGLCGPFDDTARDITLLIMCWHIVLMCGVHILCGVL